MFLNKRKKLLLIGFFFLCALFIWQVPKKPAVDADWQTHLAVPSLAEFKDNLVFIKNVRNFRYGPTEEEMQPAYYDKTYNLEEIKQVWFVVEPFNGQKYLAHTFLSFEFESGDFLAITIEARKTKNQKYGIIKGALRTFPLMYIAADERDVVLLRANLRQDNVYTYPVKLARPENARLLLTDMLERMNELVVKPAWYNTFLANCTSSIVYHVNRVSPSRVGNFSWKLWFTGYSDRLALQMGLIDTDLSLKQARQKYLITPRSQQIGDAEDYSRLIRQFE
ncbi:MAG: DUF4105 domain-containing protein [Candidatus Komeilibacteria bacterium]|nr:DUF4105 domain-containing protein [Candidatus Komeilibacteria bacterium]